MMVDAQISDYFRFGNTTLDKRFGKKMTGCTIHKITDEGISFNSVIEQSVLDASSTELHEV